MVLVLIINSVALKVDEMEDQEAAMARDATTCDIPDYPRAIVLCIYYTPLTPTELVEKEDLKLFHSILFHFFYQLQHVSFSEVFKKNKGAVPQELLPL